MFCPYAFIEFIFYQEMLFGFSYFAITDCAKSFLPEYFHNYVFLSLSPVYDRIGASNFGYYQGRIQKKELTVDNLKF